MFVMPSAEFHRYDACPGHGQFRLLDDVREVLLPVYPDTHVSSDGRIVVMDSGLYDVRVSPVFLLRNGNYFVADTRNGGKWREANPRSQAELIGISNRRSNGNTVRLIKMIKAWKHHCDVPIKSLVLELSAIDFLERFEYHDRTSDYYDLMIRDFIRWLLHRLDHNYRMPGIREPIGCGNEWEEKTRNAFKTARMACVLESERSFATATREWRRIFGERFEYVA